MINLEDWTDYQRSYAKANFKIDDNLLQKHGANYCKRLLVAGIRYAIDSGQILKDDLSAAMETLARAEH